MSTRPVEYDATETFILECLMGSVHGVKTRRQTVGDFTFAVTNLKSGVKVQVKRKATGEIVHEDIYERCFGLYDVTHRVDADLRGAQ